MNGIKRENLFSLETTGLEATGQIEPQDWFTAPQVQAIFDALEAGGAEVRFVGGCVRDALAKRPVNDVDIATTTRPKETIRLLEAAGIRAIPTGIEHGTITGLVDGNSYQITTLREDIKTDGRHAQVIFGEDWIADATRRDFTINAMSATRNGAVYDPFNGILDLAYGRVTFIGKPGNRIAEDYLRILRFFRFQSTHGRPPTSREALAACRLEAKKLRHLSGERVRDEMMKIIAENNAPDILIMMNGELILKHVLPEAKKFGDLRALNWLCTTAINLDGIGLDPVRNLVVLLPPRTDPTLVKNLTRRWAFSNAILKRLLQLTDFTPPDPLGPHTGHTRQLFVLGAGIYSDRCLITWSRELADKAKLDKERKQAWIDLMERIVSWQQPVFPLQGDDLLRLGMEQGPAIGHMLEQVRNWWIDTDCTAGHDECLETLKNLLKTA